MSFDADLGYHFPNGCRITHGTGANVKKPFDFMSLIMHTFTITSAKNFHGQLGYIEFTTEHRLPRHIHMDLEQKKLVDERIMVIGGVGIVEVAGEYWVVAPGSLVDAIGGVPHTWSACPAGVKLPDGTVSNGTFTMIFEYEDETKFFPTKSTKCITDVADYEEHKGDLEEIRFPVLTAQDVVDKAKIIFNKDKLGLELQEVEKEANHNPKKRVKTSE